jgi:DNA polymerase
MIEQIRQCQKCSLCTNQKPLLDSQKECQVFWVGLSAKKMISDLEVPLSPETNTGKVIQKIEDMCENIITYKTNLVKCVPLKEQQKLRYPSKSEIDSCFENLAKEINVMSPKIVFLLGEKVYSSVGKHLQIDFEKWDEFEYHQKEFDGTYYVPIHHPSYIYVYKRKKVEQYAESIKTLINGLLHTI